jgi:hypothetical protein
MTGDEWKDLNHGDVLVNKFTHEAYVVMEANTIESEYVVALSRVVLATHPEEWDRKRKTVDVQEV